MITRAEQSYDDDFSLKTVNNKFLNCNQMIQKFEYQEDKIQSLCLSNFNNTKKVNILQKMVSKVLVYVFCKSEVYHTQ